MKIGLSLDEMAMGGGPKFMLDLGRRLVAAGHAVTVLAEGAGAWEPLVAANGLAVYHPPPHPWLGHAWYHHKLWSETLSYCGRWLPLAFVLALT